MDELVVKKAQKGDRESFTAAIMEVKDQAYRIAYCYLKNEADSMDAVCDAVEKAFKNIKKLKHTEFFATWFIRIVINECKLQIRRSKKAIEAADRLYEKEIYQIDREDRMDLAQMLEQLDSADRILIYMKYYMGYSLEEIARASDLPVGTVKTRIYSNLKNIKEKMEVREV